MIVDFRSRQVMFGLAYGYSQLQAELLEGLEALDVHHDPTAPVALHIEPPMRFAPVEGKRNVLFTMWESLDLPPECRPRLREADRLVVPCRWNIELFRPHTNAPIDVVPLGVDADLFSRVRRTWPRYPGESFEWLFVGAPNPRKGVDVIQAAWNRHRWFERGDCHVRFKITDLTDAAQWEAMSRSGFERRAPDVLVNPRWRVMLDGRHLSRLELARLYQHANAFLFPTGGEGFGLTLIEAMATGLPAITTNYGGHLEYADGHVAMLPWRHYVTPCEMHGVDYELKVGLMTALADPEALNDEMERMIGDYRGALKRARAGAAAVRAFSWRRTAGLLREVIRLATGEARRAA